MQGDHDSSMYYDDSVLSKEEMDIPLGTDRMGSPDDDDDGGDDARIEHHQDLSGDGTPIEDRSPAEPASEELSKTKETLPFHDETPDTDVLVTYNDDDPVAFDSRQTAAASIMVMDRNSNKGEKQDGSPAGNPTSDHTSPAGAEFDAIVRDASHLLDKKLENNRDWVKKLLHEMTLYAKTLSEVHSEYTRIQLLEHEESQRLDQVEPDVQGATSHLLEHPLFGGGMANHHSLTVGNIAATAGSKRKSDQG